MRWDAAVMAESTGVIKEDRLGLDAIYLQAKRWDGTPSGRPEIQKFVGALHGQRARKGVFLTTSSFVSTVQEFHLKRLDLDYFVEE